MLKAFYFHGYYSNQISIFYNMMEVVFFVAHMPGSMVLSIASRQFSAVLPASSTS